MIIKRPPDPRRLRSLPPHGFGWIDHRLLRDGYLSRASAPALALYCLLVCAADQQGLSYYSEARLCALLSLDLATLLGARRELLELGLLAYAKPLYQVLALKAREWSVPKEPSAPEPAPRAPIKSRLQRVSPAMDAPAAATAATAATAAAPRGLDLRAMVAATLQEGGGAA